MSDLDEAMLKHIDYIVNSEYRPFTYKDFLIFEVNGAGYNMKHGTFRNKISELNKRGDTELYCKSGIAFYTLKGKKFGNRMTHNHTVVHSNPLYNILQDLRLDKQCIHDIHLRFKVPNIWNLFSVNPIFFMNKKSKDISIPAWNRDKAIIKVVIHKTDVVSVIVGCSSFPISLDPDGIIRFFASLVSVEERIHTILQNSILTEHDIKYSIPDYKSWTITMWHFGRDALTEYGGERFSITIEYAQHILTRIYAKRFNYKKRIRIECQEYPKKPLEEAIHEKIYGVTHAG